MVLQTAWFVVLACIGLGALVYSGIRDARGQEDYKALLVGVFALACALVMGWDFTISHVWSFINGGLPELGTDLHYITALILSTGVVVCCILGIAVWTPSVGSWLARKSIAHRTQSQAVSKSAGTVK